MLPCLRQGEGWKVRGREHSSYLCRSNAAHHISEGIKGAETETEQKSEVKLLSAMLS